MILIPSMDPPPGPTLLAPISTWVRWAGSESSQIVETTAPSIPVRVSSLRPAGGNPSTAPTSAHEDSEGLIRAVGEVEEANDLVGVVYRFQGITCLRCTASYDKQSDESASGDRAQGQV